MEVVDGCRLVNSVVVTDYVEKSFLERWSLKKLGFHPNALHQNVYKLLISPVYLKFTFLACTALNIEDIVKESEKLIKDELLPNPVKHSADKKNRTSFCCQ